MMRNHKEWAQNICDGPDRFHAGGLLNYLQSEIHELRQRNDDESDMDILRRRQGSIAALKDLRKNLEKAYAFLRAG